MKKVIFILIFLLFGVHFITAQQEDFNANDLKTWDRSDDWNQISRENMQTTDAVNAVSKASDVQIRSYWDEHRPLTDPKGGEIEILKRIYPNLKDNVFDVPGNEYGKDYIITKGIEVEFYTEKISISYTEDGRLRVGEIIITKGNIHVNVDGSYTIQSNSEIEIFDKENTRGAIIKNTKTTKVPALSEIMTDVAFIYKATLSISSTYCLLIELASSKTFIRRILFWFLANKSKQLPVKVLTVKPSLSKKIPSLSISSLFINSVILIFFKKVSKIKDFRIPRKF